ncbi:uncharacterized protein LOC132289629 [Cornus florida]|uniref:uncharacterized protein LOC132289629 n=1 Tax=Cornus florida TaxID=4283 RepID=UPI0028A23EC5|nr:uncharacterized protein LOC132289629 [Cornus florida]
MHSLTEGVKDLTKKFNAFALMSTNAQCYMCSSSSHPSEACPVYSTSEPSDAQVCAFNTYRRPTANTFSQTYHPDTRNHPNFSWQQNLPPQNLGGHPGFQGTLPSQLEINLQAKGVHHIETSSSTDQSNGHVNSIITLRSRKQIDNKVELPTQHEHEPSESRALNPPKAKKDRDSQINNPILLPYVPPAPFPSRLVNNKKDLQYSEISENFQNLQINIPFLTAIKQIPSYAKFIKDLVKRKTHIPKEVFIAQHCSSFLQNQAIVKHKNPGSPTITCRIGDTFADQALLDLVASVNLLPYSVYQELGLNNLRKTDVRIQLADRSVKTPRGIIEDVIVKVADFYYPIDFIVLDTQPTQGKQIPIILGCPFLATANALIDCRNENMTLTFRNMKVEVNVFSLMKQPPDSDSIEEETQLLEVLRANKEAIGWSIDDIKGISPLVVQYRIHLENDAKTCRQPQRRLNPNLKEVVRTEVIKLLDAGIIYPIFDSQWVSPVQVVPKKSGITVVPNDRNELVPTRVRTGWRVCIDYRKLNSATRKDHFPLPFIDQMLEKLAGKSFYCFLDGYSGYNQIPVHPDDQHKTTFTCPFGTFAYRRMPFGLCDALATF